MLAKKLGVTKHHSDLITSAKLDNVPSTEDIPEGQVIVRKSKYNGISSTYMYHHN